MSNGASSEPPQSASRKTKTSKRRLAARNKRMRRFIKGMGRRFFSKFSEKVECIAPRQRHDRALGVHAGRGAKQAGVVDEEIFETMNASERVRRAFRPVFTDGTGGKKVNGHEVGEAVREHLR